ncbi:late control protein [Empedobacter brevis]
MLFVLQSKIIIGKYTFSTITDVQIEKSVTNLCDTATIQMPTKFKVKGDDNKFISVEEAIKKGDEVEIYLGYENKYFGLEFKGYVSKISPKYPLEIQCEDSIFLLRNRVFNKTFNEPTELKDILQFLVQDLPIKLSDKIPKFKFNKYIIKNANGAQVLQDFKLNYLLTSFIDDDNKLFVGLQQDINNQKYSAYDLNYNIIENNLEFSEPVDDLVQFVGIYKDNKNKEHTYKIGKEGGSVRKTNFKSSINDFELMKKLIDEQYNAYLKGGYSGSVKSFLIPFATRGMTAKIFDSDHKNRQGKYFIEKVKVSYGTSGARRDVYISNIL